jgi:RNA polymerase sigma-70 factor (family 1)
LPPGNLVWPIEIIYDQNFCIFIATKKNCIVTGTFNQVSPLSANTLEQRFETLFRTYNQGIYQLALKLTKSPQQACDIMQDVFIKLWESRLEWEEIRNIEAWLYRVTKNRLIDFFRKVAADQRVREKLWDDLEKMQASPQEELDLKEVSGMIHQIVNELPPQRRMVYQLSRDEGLSYHEIAEELSISRHTVKNQLSLALRFLQKKLSLE